MPEFNAILLREKFTIEDIQSGELQDRPPLIALSNRMALPLVSDSGAISEHFVIRAQNMHTCVRFAAHLAREFQEGGPIMHRSKKFDWDYAWISITKGYEKKWNPSRWVAIYHKGRVIFEASGEQGGRHPFLDIIEQCDARNKGDYEQSLEIAKDAFRQAGKMVTIKYDGNIALNLAITDAEGRCGVILRGPTRTTTFNFTAKPKAGRLVRSSQCLSVAAAFLEGIQMTFMVGMVSYKSKMELIEQNSPEAKQGLEAGQKLGRLKGAVDQFENLLDVSYRPDRPDFSEMVNAAEIFAKQLMVKQERAKAATEAEAETQNPI